MDRLKKTKRVLFVEGRSDLPILRALAAKMGVEMPEEWVEWRTTRSQKERKQLYLSLLEEIPDLVALSLRDRDDEPIETVDTDLRDKSVAEGGGFFARKWRRRYIESYLIWPPAIATVTGLSVKQSRRS